MCASGTHRPVLFEEALDALSIEPSGLYIDGTFGRGGHSGAILQRLGDEGSLLAIDKDPGAVAWGEAAFGADSRFEITKGSFAMLEQFVSAREWFGRVNGILLDLGVSSPQLDTPERGFSFLNDGPLDMRMDNSSGMSAAEWLAQAKEGEMVKVFKEYGEERYARRIAKALVAARDQAPILRTGQLAEIIKQAHPAWERGKHPATRCFQAIRIHVNRELEDLRAGLQGTLGALCAGGRLVVISFHSLEDRIVKRFIREGERGDDYPAGLPVTQAQLRPRMRRIGKAIRPGRDEVDVNPRARSAVLRVAERLA